VTELISRLEGGWEAQLFASGMSAVVTLFQSLEPGDHVIIPDGVYNGTCKWLNRNAGPWGLDFTQLSENDPENLQRAVKPGKTKLIWIETPSNPLWKITDIEAFTQIAREVGAYTVADNTVATPVLTRPIEFGVDIIMHSATKALNGHGDILMGALVTKENNPIWQSIRRIAHDAGALPGSFETWLLLRGMRTLFLRMKCICVNAQQIAEHLQNHPKVTRVHYPGLPGFSGHDTAKKQMSDGFGGMLSIQILGGRESAVRVQANTRIFQRATSLGTTQSLIEHRASYEGPGSPVPDDLLRLSIGIENANDLINDLE
jgi:cystathionine gamma-synthase